MFHPLIETASRCTGCRLELAFELAVLFEPNCREAVLKIPDFLSDKNYRAIADVTHQLRMGLSLFFPEQLAQHCEKLELLARAEKSEAIEHELQSFMPALKTAYQDLTWAIEESSSGS